MAEVKKTAAAKSAAKAASAEAKSEEAKTDVAAAKETSKSTKKTTAKKTTAKKAAKETTAKEATVKETTAKTAGRKAATKAVVHVQFSGKSYTTEDWVKSAKDVWEYDLDRNPEDFKSVELYVKPEENKVYYVINGDVSGDFNI